MFFVFLISPKLSPPLFPIFSLRSPPRLAWHLMINRTFPHFGLGRRRYTGWGERSYVRRVDRGWEWFLPHRPSSAHISLSFNPLPPPIPHSSSSSSSHPLPPPPPFLCLKWWNHLLLILKILRVLMTRKVYKKDSLPPSSPRNAEEKSQKKWHSDISHS